MRDDKTRLAVFVAHRPRLVEYAANVLGSAAQSEDVVQEAWVRFSAVAGSRPIEDPLSYLFRIVRNIAIDGRRRRAREALVILPEVDGQAETQADERPSPEAEVLARAELLRLQAVMAELPERTRIALEMRRFGDMKLREIADHLGISVTVAHTIIADGLAYCRRRVRPPS